MGGLLAPPFLLDMDRRQVTLCSAAEGSTVRQSSVNMINRKKGGIHPPNEKNTIIDDCGAKRIFCSLLHRK